MVNKYYQKNKEKLWKEEHKRYQNLSEKEKDTDRYQNLPRDRYRDRYQNLPKDEKSVSITVIKIRIFLKEKNKIKLSIREIIT